MVLPQAQGEPDDLVELRLRYQAETARTVVPYDAHLESVDEFKARTHVRE